MDTTLLVSPTERGPCIAALARLLGADQMETSSLPERYGVDFLWRGHHGWYGVQRKEIRDFAASREDGRLRKELAQMAHKIELPIIVLEGKLVWTNEGVAEIARGKFVTRAAWLASKLSFAQRGAYIIETPTAEDTAVAIVTYMEWSLKAKHQVASPRPKAAGEYGKASSREWAAHLLQGFEGVGGDTAMSIVEHFDGVPLAWTVTEKELRDVPGVGKGRAAGLINALIREGV